MKRFFGKLFWRGNSRNGILFGVLLNTLVWTLVVFPCMLNWLFMMYEFMDNANYRLTMNLFGTTFIIGVVIALYASMLCALYCNDLMKTKLRRVAESPNRHCRDSATRRVIRTFVAVFCVLPPVAAIVFLVCAIRSANKKAVAFSCAFVAAILLLAVFAFTDVFGESVVWLELIILLYVAELVFAVIAFDGFSRASRWGCASVIFLAAMMAFGEIANVALNRAVEKRMPLLGDAEDVDAHYNRFLDEQKMIYTGERLPYDNFDMREYRLARPRYENFTPLSDETLRLYANLFASNVVQLAQADEMFAPDKTVADYEALANPVSFFRSFSLAQDWITVEGVKMRLAAHNRDTDGMLEANRRMNITRDLFRDATSRYSFSFFLFQALEGMRIARLQAIVPVLPDNALAELRAEIDETFRFMESELLPDAHAATIERICGMNDAKRDLDKNRKDEILRERKSTCDKPHRHRDPRPWYKRYELCFSKPQVKHLFRFYDVLLGVNQLLVLSDYSEYVAVMGAHEIAYHERLATVESLTKKPERKPLFNALIFRTAHRDSLAMAHRIARVADTSLTATTAIAVEQYRRAHNAFPETLDALVPEFLETVPHSYVNGEPLAYECGDITVPVEQDVTTELYGFWIRGGDTKYGPIKFVVPLDSPDGKTPRIITPETQEKPAPWQSLRNLSVSGHV